MCRVTDLLGQSAADPTDYVQKILTRVAEKFRVTTEQMTHGGRKELHVVMARHVAMYVLRNTGLSFPQVGRIMDRHHATVIWACEKLKWHCERSPEFANLVDELAGKRVQLPERTVTVQQLPQQVTQADVAL